jgi:hypothetical protein
MGFSFRALQLILQPQPQVSLTPGFNPVDDACGRQETVFNGFYKLGETVETVGLSFVHLFTWLKPGVNEKGVQRYSARVLNTNWYGTEGLFFLSRKVVSCPRLNQTT